MVSPTQFWYSAWTFYLRYWDKKITEYWRPLAILARLMLLRICKKAFILLIICLYSWWNLYSCIETTFQKTGSLNNYLLNQLYRLNHHHKVIDPITYDYFSVVGSMIAKNELSKQIIIGESVSSGMWILVNQLYAKS